MSKGLEKFGISQNFLNEVVNYCSSNRQIDKVILFGSRARGDYQSSSDIDLAVYTNNATHSQQNLIAYNIQELLTHLKIDVLFMDRLTKAALISNIKKEGVVIYEQGKALREA